MVDADIMKGRESPVAGAAIVGGQGNAAFIAARLTFYAGTALVCITVLRPLGGVTLSDWLFLAAVALTASEAVLRGRVSVAMPKGLLLGMALLVLGGVLSSAGADAPAESMIGVGKYVYLVLIWFWLATVVLRSYSQLESAVTLWSVSAGLAGAAAVAQLVWGEGVPGTSITWGRMTGWTEHINDLGGVTGIALVPALALALAGRGLSGARILRWLVVCLIAAGLVLSGSLSGVAAAAAGVVSFAVLERVRTRVLVGAGLVVVAVGYALSSAERWGLVEIAERVDAIIERPAEFETLQMRVEGYAAAWESIRESPVFGVGVGQGVDLPGQDAPAVHNIFLMFWYEAGLVGLVGILILLWSIASVGLRELRLAPGRRESRLIASLLSAYIAFITFGVAQPIYFKRFGWIAAALVLAAGAVRARETFPGRARSVGGESGFDLPAGAGPWTR